MTSGVVILNGSPHSGGNSALLARRLAALLGGTQTTVDLYAADVRPCTGCGACVDSGRCVLEDDAFAGIMRRLAESRYAVVASPVHFSGPSAPLTAFISRFQLYWGRDVSGMFPGVAGLVATGGSEYNDMFLAVRKVTGAAFKTLGMPLAGLVGVSGTDRVPAADAPDVPERLAGLAESMRNALRQR